MKLKQRHFLHTREFEIHDKGVSIKEKFPGNTSKLMYLLMRSGIKK